MPQESIRWQGTQRRACGPGAHWNVQVVRGKVTTRCLWHACKALGIGLLLMLLGACMATIGYYADQLSVAQEIRGNLTIKVKNESREFHLNNLSYAGPIVMGVGGFIVVAVCVMTFEARDSAAKVVPARFRLNQTMKGGKRQRNRRSTSSQTSKWDQQMGLFRINRSLSPSGYEISKRQLKAELLRYSRDLYEKDGSRSIKKSPSAPLLLDKKSPRREAPRYAGCALLNPELLKRHALSVDNPAYSPPQLIANQTSRESLECQRLCSSQASMTMDLHVPNKGPVTLRVKDRSDTARRHQLLRQTKIEDVEETGENRRPGFVCSPRFSSRFTGKRNSIDLRLLEEIGVISRDYCKISPRDFRKLSSPNFRKMSFDKIAGECRLDRSMASRKASFEFRRSPDFRRGDYRFSMDCGKCALEEAEVIRRQRYPKLHHSRSDDNRRRSFDRSRCSLNTQTASESVEYETRYFVSTSVSTEESRSDNPDDNSRPADLDEAAGKISSIEGQTEGDALLEEPELENENEHTSLERLADCTSNGSDNAQIGVEQMMLRDWKSARKEESVVNVEDEV